MPHTSLPPDYAACVYVAVLGKLIGVYLGRPLEGWTYEPIMAEREKITGLEQFEGWYPEPYRLIHIYRRGMLIQGTRGWTDY
jgi:hypothetical protein